MVVIDTVTLPAPRRGPMSRLTVRDRREHADAEQIRTTRNYFCRMWSILGPWAVFEQSEG